MDFERWEPYYLRILSEFGYSRAEDEKAARIIDSLVPDENIISIEEICIKDWSTVSVLGDAPSLSDALKKMKLRGIIVSAGPATARSLELGIIPDLFVTDLDGPVEADIKANEKGSIGVIHAHGDNIDRIKTYAERFRKILLTTQSAPFGRLHNFGGFTDGDRAVMMARHLGAKTIDLVGFDFESPTLKEGSEPNTKRKKLQWAKRLIFEENPDDVIIRMV
ncbi:MAG: DUF115 domain-containing protein [Methanomassiliicoccales archaeon]|nr:MAG: DUF115 domain-containing protein [Methanomassiliicoccales archaeon]